MVEEDFRGHGCNAKQAYPVFHDQHIEIQYHFVRKLIMDGEVDLVYCLTKDNAADIFTKALGRDLLDVEGGC